MKRWFWACLFLFLLLLCPLLGEAEVSYAGMTFTGEEEYIDLGTTVVSDFSEFTAFLDQMPRLKHVDMWSNRMTRDRCDSLASRYPEMRWGWTMVVPAWDHEHLVRTDYTSFSTLHNNKSGKHSSEDFSVLRYCWHLKALDIGHNKVDDLSFLYQLPELRVLIIACNEVSDITPIGSLKYLEYSELFNNDITDISPLQDLVHMLDLNLGFNKIADLSPVKNLKKLQRLWLFSSQRFKQSPAPEVVHDIQAALPDVYIDTTHHPTAGGWRGSQDKKHPHYVAIQAMFGEDHDHPRYDYVPFEESWTPDQTPDPEETPSPLANKSASLPLLTQQHFDNKHYLLPVDFTPGSTPKPEGYQDDRTYSDSTITVSIGEGTTGAVEYWYADIQLTDASQFRTMGVAKDGSFDRGGQMNGLALAEQAAAVVAINGDGWTAKERHGMGYIMRQGKLYQNNLAPAHSWKPLMMDLLLVDEDGDFIPVKKPIYQRIPALINGKRILNSFAFGPVLVENGEPVKNYRDAEKWLDMAPDHPHQRMCICQVDHLKYKVVCCSGNWRDKAGMTLREFADLVASLGVQTAYNLDGGYTTLLYFNGQRINEFGSKKHRNLNDLIYFASAE